MSMSSLGSLLQAQGKLEAVRRQAQQEQKALKRAMAEDEAERARQEAEAKRGPRPPSATAEMSRQRDMSLSDVLSSGADDNPPNILG